MTETAGRRPTPLEVAQAFHEAYEQLAPAFGYSTRKESAVPWGDVPQANRDLMVATVRAVLIEKYDLLSSSPSPAVMGEKGL